MELAQQIFKVYCEISGVFILLTAILIAIFGGSFELNIGKRNKNK